MASKIFYALAIVVLIAGLVEGLTPDGPCGMDDDLCMAQRGWAPTVASLAFAGLLAFVGRAVADKRDHDRASTRDTRYR